MKLLKTQSFELATISAGDENSSKLALLLPGRLDTKDYAHMRGHVDFLATKGYFALSFDPPGTWESPGDITLYTTQNYFQAINELIEVFGNKPSILMGHSRGGSMAMLAGITNPHVTHFISAMSHYGPSEANEKVKRSGVSISYRDLPPGTEETTDKKRFDLPLSYFEDSTKWIGIEKCSKPKLFFLGIHDDTVAPEEIREVYKLAAAPKKLCELNLGHNYRYRPDIINEVNKVTWEFLDSYS